jgi:osmotically-inducible protein OsmY
MILRITNQMEQTASPSCAIAATAEARFQESPYRALRAITCKAEQGVLVLEGRLSSFFQKQLAQELVANIEGVVQVVNHIEVVSSDQRHFRRRPLSSDRFVG